MRSQYRVEAVHVQLDAYAGTTVSLCTPKTRHEVYKMFDERFKTHGHRKKAGDDAPIPTEEEAITDELQDDRGSVWNYSPDWLLDDDLALLRDDDYEVLPANNSNAPKIMFVDDDYYDNQDYSYALAAVGFEVFRVDNADSALRLALACPFVAIILDVRMDPGRILGHERTVGGYRTGEALAGELRDIDQFVRIVALSKTDDPMVIEWFENLENGTFYPKYRNRPRKFAKNMKKLLSHHFVPTSSASVSKSSSQGSTDSPLLPSDDSCAGREADREERMIPANELSTRVRPQSCQSAIVVVATGWGPSFGGINSFNIDFCLALSRIVSDDTCVVCVTSGVDDVTRSFYEEQYNIRLVTLPRINDVISDDVATSAAVLLRKYQFRNVPLVCGHDVITGAIAISLSQVLHAQSLVFHHMSYISYQAIKRSGRTAREMDDEQRNVFQKAKFVVAVGPLLKESAERLCQRDIPMVVPGLATITKITHRAKNAFRAITFGRLGGEDDPIKQGSLAVAGYGRYIKMSANQIHWREHRFSMFGLSEAQYSTEEAAIKALMHREAERVVAVNATPYTEDRTSLYQALADNEVAMMLSWHEGFGLVGWEAIAAGVPLIVSKHTGLYKLLAEDDNTFGADCLTMVDVRGSTHASDPDENDIKEVADALFKISTNLDRYFSAADKLRKYIIDKYTWDSCARAALQACSWTEFRR
ncbi:MAG: hypothetical protein JWP89_6885 [Schlesneria sp.]|nr:hypothetical protein [Schlesneria sp.]